MHASTLQRIEKDYLDIAKKVGVVGWNSSDPQIDKLRLVKDWFEKTASGHWILILDNADDVDLLFGSSRLADCFPRSLNGAILLTTRNKQVASKFATTQEHILHVQAFKNRESVYLLRAKIGDQFREDDYVRLANALDHVPLALVQAAAFIGEQEISISKYLSHYNKSDNAKIQLLSEEFEDEMRDKDTRNPVAATFAISFAQIRKSDSRAAELLSMMSMLDAQAIPTSLLPLDEGISSTKAIGMLQAFSLVTKASQNEEEDHFFDIHRLVRLAMRNWLSINLELKLWVRKAITNLGEQFPQGIFENRKISRTYLPHALVVLSSEQILRDPSVGEIIQPSQQALKDAKLSLAALQFNLSSYYNAMHDYNSSAPIAQASLASRETVLGNEHPDTIYSMQNLAWVLNGQGKHDEAEKLNRQALSLGRRTLGTNDSLVLHSMLDLTWILKNQNKFDEAEKLGRQTLALSIQALGREDSGTLESMHNLAAVFESQGKYDQAEKIIRQTLVLSDKVLGTEHSATLSTMNNLGLVLKLQGRYDEAEKMNRHTLILKEKVVGMEHPDTLMTMINLVVVLERQRKYEEAEKINRQTLTRSQKVSGTEHANTLLTMNNLAVVLKRQGKYEESEDIARQTLMLRIKVLGTHHPHTSISMRLLTSVLDKQGKHNEAEHIRNTWRDWPSQTYLPPVPPNSNSDSS